jgi:hypothetical protein
MHYNTGSVSRLPLMSAHDALKSRYLSLKWGVTHNRLQEYLWLCEQEIDSWRRWVRLPLRRRLELYRHGFTSPFGRLYDIETHGYDAYLSELQRYRLFREMNGEHRYLLDDKLSQYWMLADFPDHRPRAFGLLADGKVHHVSGSGERGPPPPVAEWLPSKLRDQEKLVLKHLRGKGGKEVLVCEYDGGFRLDDEPVTEAELVAAVRPLSSYLVSEFVRQHHYAADLYPHASNTLRLFTLYDEVTEEVHLAMAVHRIGTDRSRPIDNFAAGGLAAMVDAETGTLGPAAQYPYSGGSMPWYTDHPDTGAPIAGTTVPYWSEVWATIEEMALECSNLPAIGWDVIIDESGEPVVIEANTGTGLDILQIHRPLLTDPRVATIVSRYLPEVDPQPTPETNGTSGANVEQTTDSRQHAVPSHGTE